MQSQVEKGSQTQYLNVMKAMWDIVDKHYDPKKILTEAGHALIQTYAIKAAHPQLPATPPTCAS